MEEIWSIQEVVKAVRTTSQSNLIRLQRILLLKEMGIGLAQIQEVIDGKTEDLLALVEHRQLLFQEKERLSRLIISIDKAIHEIEGDKMMSANQLFDGSIRKSIRKRRKSDGQINLLKAAADWQG
jgi:DNA-binding transcriptional MerR regulator